MYYGGLGVSQYFEEAVRWYRKAADQGNDIAQESLELARASLGGAAAVSKEAEPPVSSHHCACCGLGLRNRTKTQALLSMQTARLLW
jgi:TPR repeat protein